MPYDTLLVESAGHVATIVLNRPDKRNSINTQMIADLQSALDAIEQTHARVVILTGAGSSFCAGMDLAMLQAIARQSPSENQEDSRRIAKLFRRVWSYSKPMIAAVNGHALAGGCGLATLCDFTIAVPEAKFGYTEVKIGFLPAIVSVFLTRQIGEKRTRDLLLTGRLVEAAEFKDLGLVNEIVPADRLMTRVQELAEVLIAVSRLAFPARSDSLPPQLPPASTPIWNARSSRTPACATLPTSRKASPASSRNVSPSGKTTRTIPRTKLSRSSSSGVASKRDSRIGRLLPAAFVNEVSLCVSTTCLLVSIADY